MKESLKTIVKIAVVILLIAWAWKEIFKSKKETNES